jgi:hypothetical protein
MNSIARALNNIAISVQNLANAFNTSKDQNKSIVPTTVTSNPLSSNVTITSVAKTKEVAPYLKHDHTGMVSITKEEKRALDTIYNALADKGNHPSHHDHVMRELSTKWPVLHSALNQLIRVRKYYYNSSSSDIWKDKQKW